MKDTIKILANGFMSYIFIKTALVNFTLDNTSTLVDIVILILGLFSGYIAIKTFRQK